MDTKKHTKCTTFRWHIWCILNLTGAQQLVCRWQPLAAFRSSELHLYTTRTGVGCAPVPCALDAGSPAAAPSASPLPLPSNGTRSLCFCFASLAPREIVS